ncbi:MAG: alpha-galactosidase [Bacillota bacterium]|nr:alpha-galactosidase [Bacillota bacterium]
MFDEKPHHYMTVLPSEFNQASLWIERLTNKQNLPYSFAWNGQKVDFSQRRWRFSVQSDLLDAARTQYTTTLTDAMTGLEITCIAVQYHRYAAVEWTLWYENTGSADTQVLSDLCAIDAELLEPDLNPDVERIIPAVRLYHFIGDYNAPDNYAPVEHFFHAYEPLTLRSQGGRPVDMGFPYVRAQDDLRGVILAISWQGQWEAKFQAAGITGHRQRKDGLHARAWQQHFHAKLLPGEKVRTPMIVLMPYEGDDGIRAQNLWRRWFLEYNIPRQNGEPIKPYYFVSNGELMERVTQKGHLQLIDTIAAEGLPADYLWMDAGWYEDVVDTYNALGTWKPHKKRFPDGIRIISEQAHRHGIKTLLWFEPERARAGSEIHREHPDWLIRHPYLKKNMLLDLSNEDAFAWILERILSLIKSEAVDCYRSDFNMDPLLYWQNGEPIDRQGIRENKHCIAYLRLFDEILRANPGILIDSCASGGRRNDLETLRRSVPLHITDYFYENLEQLEAGAPDLTAKQAMHHSLFQWIPYFGSGYVPGPDKDHYHHRSVTLIPFINSMCLTDLATDFEQIKCWQQEWREVAHCLYGDYYPLTPYSRDARDWIGWQFHLEASEEGVIQVFMRAQSVYDQGTFRLRGLNIDAKYEVKDYNTGVKRIIIGAELMEDGLKIVMFRRPDSALFHYCRV